MKSLDTVTTVEAGNSLRRDSIRINGIVPTTGEEARARVVIDKLREVAGEKTRVRVESRNANVKGKGLGFSASGFAASGLVRGRQAWSRVCRAESRRRILDLVCEPEGTLVCGAACVCEFYQVEDTDCSYSICDKD